MVIKRAKDAAGGGLIQAERLRQARPSGSRAVSLLSGLGAGLKKLKLLSLPLSTSILSNAQRESRATRTIIRVRSMTNFLITAASGSQQIGKEKSELFINRLEIFKTLINCFKTLKLCDRTNRNINIMNLLKRVVYPGGVGQGGILRSLNERSFCLTGPREKI